MTTMHTLMVLIIGIVAVGSSLVWILQKVLK